MGTARTPVRPGPPGPPLRLLPAPRTEPPYEDETRSTALPGQLLLPLTRPAPPAGDAGPRGRPADARGRRTPAPEARPSAGGGSPGTRAAAETRVVAWRFATRYAEIVDGRRAAAHLGPLSEPAAVSRLSADALRAREHLRALTHPARPGGGRAGARPHGRGDAAAVALSGVRVQLVQPRVAEAVALLRLRGVVRALAFRLDHRPEGWRVTAAELVGAGSGHAAQG